MRIGVLLLTAATLAPSVPLTAQTYRTMASSRRHMGEESLRAYVRFGVGDLRIHPEDGPTLYRVGLVYDEDHFSPRVTYDPRQRVLHAGVSKHRGNIAGHLRHGTDQRLDLALSRTVPIDLTIEFGAGAADVDLGGLTLTAVNIATGASETAIRFGEPNLGTCDRLTIKVGAAEFRAEQLGNARCRMVEVDGGVGALRVDLTGAWPDGVHRVDVNVGLGEVQVTLPPGVGVRMEVHRFIAGVDHSGFTRRGSHFYSDDYESAAVKLHLDVRATFGGIDIDWAER